MIGSAAVVTLAEAAAEDRLDPQCSKGRRRELRIGEPLRPPLVGGEVDRRERECAEWLERRLTRLPDLEILTADRQAWLLLQRIGRDDRHDAIGVWKWQPFE
jgi:hypothetical protein